MEDLARVSFKRAPLYIGVDDGRSKVSLFLLAWAARCRDVNSLVDHLFRIPFVSISYLYMIFVICISVDLGMVMIGAGHSGGAGARVLCGLEYPAFPPPFYFFKEKREEKGMR